MQSKEAVATAGARLRAAYVASRSRPRLLTPVSFLLDVVADVVVDDFNILVHFGRDLVCTLVVWLALDAAVLFLLGRIAVDFLDATTAVAAASRLHPGFKEACASSDGVCEDVLTARLPGAYAGFEPVDESLHGALGFTHPDAVRSRSTDLPHDAADRGGEGIDAEVELVLGSPGPIAELPRSSITSTPVDAAESLSESPVRETAVDGGVQEDERSGDVGVVSASTETEKRIVGERLEDSGEDAGGGEGERQGFGAVEKESEGEPALECSLALCREREGLD